MPTDAPLPPPPRPQDLQLWNQTFELAEPVPRIPRLGDWIAVFVDFSASVTSPRRFHPGISLGSRYGGKRWIIRPVDYTATPVTVSAASILWVKIRIQELAGILPASPFGPPSIPSDLGFLRGGKFDEDS